MVTSTVSTTLPPSEFSVVGVKVVTIEVRGFPVALTVPRWTMKPLVTGGGGVELVVLVLVLLVVDVVVVVVVGGLPGPAAVRV